MYRRLWIGLRWLRMGYIDRLLKRGNDPLVCEMMDTLRPPLWLVAGSVHSWFIYLPIIHCHVNNYLQRSCFCVYVGSTIILCSETVWFPSCYFCTGLMLLSNFRCCCLAFNCSCSALCLHQAGATSGGLGSVVQRCIRGPQSIRLSAQCENIVLLPSVTMKNDVFWDIKTQFVLHRRHIMSLLQSPAS
jgi:hypothetical protein